MSNNHDDAINTGIIRVQHDRHHPYRTINTTFAQDSRLTWAARGVLVYLLSKPDGWQLRVADLIRQSSAGRDAVYAILRNLEDSGYLVRERHRGANGTFRYTNAIYEVSQDVVTAPLPDYPDMDGPYTDDPDVDDLNSNEPLPAFPEAGSPYTVEPDAVEPDQVRPRAVKPDIYIVKREETKELDIKELKLQHARARGKQQQLQHTNGNGRKETNGNGGTHTTTDEQPETDDERAENPPTEEDYKRQALEMIERVRANIRAGKP